MDMNIEQQIKYATSFQRTSAISIDIFIVAFLRIILAQILGNIWINDIIARFLSDFKTYFGTEFIKNNPEHIEFVMRHEVFSSIIIFYIILVLVGTIYHAYLNSSSWRATIGKRIVGITMMKEDYTKISFWLGVAHYFLSVLPIIYVIYIVMFQAANNINMFTAITSNPFNFAFGIAFVLWLQIQIFTKKKTTAYDLICKVIFIKLRTAEKFPWSK
ncbi:MAG TPA: RDD family protein [Rickettsiales bacterium]|nr:RDD family protein [Rickettsiales bacterium]